MYGRGKVEGERKRVTERGCVHACECACACLRARHSIVRACHARTRVRVGALWMREGEGGEEGRDGH